MYYQYDGISFENAQSLIQNEVDVQSSDEITANIFMKDDLYKNSYEFFKKRPFYPMISYAFLLLTNNNYLSLLLPNMLAYMGSIYFVLFFFRQSFDDLFSYGGTFLFIAFYPYLDWSTYFMTDTIGFFFWLLVLYCSYRFVQTRIYTWLYSFGVMYAISLTNREQGIFMVLLYALVWVLMRRNRFINSQIQNVKKLLLVIAAITMLYLIIAKLLGLKNLWDTIVYTQNSYGLHDVDRSFVEVLSYLGNTIVAFHLGLIRDLMSHHWWSFFTALGIVGIVQFLRSKKKTFIQILILASGIASYSSAFAYPVLSYRYFYPTVVMLIFFACGYIHFFFSRRKSIVTPQ